MKLYESVIYSVQYQTLVKIENCTMTEKQNDYLRDIKGYICLVKELLHRSRNSLDNAVSN